MEDTFLKHDDFIQFVKEVSNFPEHLNINQLFNIYQEIKKEKAKRSFYIALSRLQSELPVIKKNKRAVNEMGESYYYASYDDIFSEIQPYLRKYGFSVRFNTTYNENIVVVHCILTHEEGHSETSSFKAVVKNTLDIQKWGAALTYAKRYSLSLLFGLATEEDNDAYGVDIVQESVNVSKNTTDIEEEFFEEEEEFKFGNREETVEDAYSVEVNEVEESNVYKEQKEIQNQEKSTQNQIRAIFAILQSKYPKKSKADFIDIVSSMIGRKVESISTDTLTKSEASTIIEILKKEQEPF